MFIIIAQISFRTAQKIHLSDEKTNLIIKISEEGKSNAEIVKIMSCSRHQKNTDGFKGKKLSQEQNDFILDLVDENCTVTLKEIKIKLQERFGIQRRNCPTTNNIQYDLIIQFLRLISVDESRIIFMDVTGFNISMRSVYARSLRNTQPTKVVKSIRSKNVSMSCCINKDRMIFYELTERPYNRNNYGAFLLNLFTKLEELHLNRCTFIMDNVPFHKCQEIRNSITAFGHSVIYLPPYTPFLNPIKEAFSKIKDRVR
ncbi:hypothetical protein RF11_12212 [Thelohanellus kitauei]|uniref:Tc1-like transposase DDE domain-containing protein n=1 Tax=Thelohanellus kitauei TaxID=669202 RepID=A0A0C2N241_THEKT|nr:hypothetical protein RF11_12212 [Thelohanellus kitauei]